jgi:ribosome-associated toxin RatA of RatAB toxin-antitoxin module
MREVIRSALVANTPAQIYALIVDVERYPQFLPWCVASRVEQREPASMVASLSIRRGPLRAEFTTRNALEPDRAVGMSLVSGPFRSLEGLWTLTPLGEDGCTVELRMRFEFANRISGALLEPVFEETAASLVDAFVLRAREVYRA